jgi:hypothetical protein
MKKFTAILLILSALQLSAQVKPKTQYGFRVGLNSNYTFLKDNQTDIISRFRSDLHAGVFYRFNLSKTLSFQPELVYNNRGGSLKGFSVNFPETNNAILRGNSQYMSVPLILGISPAKNVFFEVGPEYSQALNYNRKYGPDRKNDLGLVLGARIDMLDMAHLFSLSFRYVYGFNDVSNDTFTSVEKVTTPLNMYNRTIQVSATYNFSDYYRWQRKYGLKKKK